MNLKVYIDIQVKEWGLFFWNYSEIAGKEGICLFAIAEFLAFYHCEEVIYLEIT